MFDPDYWRKLPSGRGLMAILQISGKIVLKEETDNNLITRGSHEIFLEPEDVQFIAKEYQNWLDAGNSPPQPGSVVAL